MKSIQVAKADRTEHDVFSDRPRKVVRVFVSSTFKDMQGEREELVKRVFPVLRKLCEERGVVWGEVDLRWGISDEQKAEGKVLPICLAEIHNSRPYFIGLLGERYGWVPDAISQELIKQEPWLASCEGRSVTEMEILHGVLNDPEMKSHAFFYLRDPAYLDSLLAAVKDEFREVPTAEETSLYGSEVAKKRAGYRQSQLAALKQKLRSSGLPLSENYRDPFDLADRVLGDFTELINRLFPANARLDPHEREGTEHEAYAASRTSVYIGRREYFERLDAHISSEEKPLLVLGESGSGKSALLANWAHRYEAANAGAPVIKYFVGATPGSAHWATMLRFIMEELRLRVGLAEEIASNPEELRNQFGNWLNMAAVNGRFVLLLDGLNQLDDRDGAQDLVWLPEETPANARIILSTLPGRALDELQKRNSPELNVEPLLPAERKELINSYLAQYTKALGSDRVDRITQTELAANPLYLCALLEELRLYGDHFSLDQRIDEYLSAQTLDDLYEKILERYEADYERDRPGLVRDAMSLIWASRNGLSEAELLDQLGENGESLPRAHLSPLFLAAERSFVNRSGLLNFSHDYLRQAVRHRYLATNETQLEAHRQIANYFVPRELSSRQVDELPYQLVESQQWEQLAARLTDLKFLALAYEEKPFDVRAVWEQVENNSSTRVRDAYKGSLSYSRKLDLKEAQALGSLLMDLGHPGKLNQC